MLTYHNEADNAFKTASKNEIKILQYFIPWFKKLE